MALLAFDTSLGAVSVALASAAPGGTSAAHRFEVRANGHAERFFELLAEVVAEAGVALSGLQRVAVTLGPGTFTGVRTGVAIARAFALSTGCEVVGITTLELMARGADRQLGLGMWASGDGASPALTTVPRRHLVVAADARRGQLYLQRFSAEAAVSAGRPCLLAIADAAALPDGPHLAVGSGAAALAEAGRCRGVDIVAALPGLEPDAGDLLAIAPCLAPLAVVRPLYLRPPDAKPPANPAVARRP